MLTSVLELVLASLLPARDEVEIVKQTAGTCVGTCDAASGGVLLISFGRATHNLRESFRGYGHEPQPPDSVMELADWLAGGIRADQTEEVLGSVGQGLAKACGCIALSLNKALDMRVYRFG